MFALLPSPPAFFCVIYIFCWWWCNIVQQEECKESRDGFNPSIWWIMRAKEAVTPLGCIKTPSQVRRGEGCFCPYLPTDSPNFREETERESWVVGGKGPGDRKQIWVCWGRERSKTSRLCWGSLLLWVVKSHMAADNRPPLLVYSLYWRQFFQCFLKVVVIKNVLWL